MATKQHIQIEGKELSISNIEGALSGERLHEGTGHQILFGDRLGDCAAP
jgi:hypothetical protein